jgi:hypothetical protein
VRRASSAALRVARRPSSRLRRLPSRSLVTAGSPRPAITAKTSPPHAGGQSLLISEGGVFVIFHSCTTQRRPPAGRLRRPARPIARPPVRRVGGRRTCAPATRAELGWQRRRTLNRGRGGCPAQREELDVAVLGSRAAGAGRAARPSSPAVDETTSASDSRRRTRSWEALLIGRQKAAPTEPHEHSVRGERVLVRVPGDLF